MAVVLINKLGEGAFADVWAAKDELDRDVAVKIVRSSLAGLADALAHAKALARVNHTNVVRVYKLDRVIDPETETEADCVVMERIHGETLRILLRRKQLTREELRHIGHSLINGLREIHANGLAHGDLHADNIMVGQDTVKILDILYLDSLAILTTLQQKDRLERDIRSLRLIIQELISNSELDPAEAAEFNALLKLDSTLNDIGLAFDQVTSPENQANDGRQLEHSYSRFLDEGFVDTQEYAFALAEVTPPRITLPLLNRIVEKNSFQPKHGIFVQQLWNRLDGKQKQEFVSFLADALDKLMPKGTWFPNLRLLSRLGENGWKLMPRLSQLRIENLIVNDTLAGYHDIFGSGAQSKGAMGTYAMSFWRYFSPASLTKLVDNLVSLLKQGWYTQNYVGKHFMHVIAQISERANRRQEVIDAICAAYENDARLIRNSIDQLPGDWMNEINLRHEKKAKKEIDLDDEIPF